MGLTSSKSTSNIERETMELEDRALKNFNARIVAYSYPHHGPYINYINWCTAEYELECIPHICRYGANYPIER